jgi:hypothetical protein
MLTARNSWGKIGTSVVPPAVLSTSVSEIHFTFIELNKPEYNLTNADIEKSKPQCQRFFTSRQPSNPLNPEYKLSKVEYREVTPPKFIRDQINN